MEGVGYSLEYYYLSTHCLISPFPEKKKKKPMSLFSSIDILHVAKYTGYCGQETVAQVGGQETELDRILVLRAWLGGRGQYGKR